MIEANRKRSLSILAIFLALAVLEKLTVLHLPANWLLGAVHVFGGAPAAFGLALFFFGARRLQPLPLRPSWSGRVALLHALVLAALLSLQFWYSSVAATLSPHSPAFRVMATVWTAFIPLALLTLFLVFVPLRGIGQLARRLALPALAAALLTTVFLLARHVGDNAWSTPSLFIRVIQRACFQQTRAVLGLFYPVVISDPDHQILGTARYVIQVSWLCSGLEGLLLVALLLALWIFFFRRELIVPRALLVAPVALALTWCANIARLAALISIGDHGHAQLADLGFHTQAGWVSLNLIVLGCLAAVQHARWFRKQNALVPAEPAESAEVNSIAVYLLPFTLILAASLLTQGLAEGFEAFYPLRVVFALFAFWVYRRQYRAMDWRFGVPGLLAGTVIGLLWLGIRLHFHTVTADVALTTSALAAATRLHRWTWIALRVLGATLTVPVAEELAFRGFAARRVQRTDFETLPYRDMNWPSFAVSSVAFGALHGRMWPAGILTGAALWAVARYKNRLGEAAAAHAAANAVIAVAAVLLHDYSLW